MKKQSMMVPTRRVAFLFLIGCLGLFGTAAGVWADPLPEFTGFTRPGVPSGRVENKDGHILLVADNGEEKKNTILGGTIYFTVIDTLLDTEENDIWRKMSRDMIRSFVPGKDSRGGSSPAFDSAARYVYLYQTVNDMPNAVDAVRHTSVFLFDPALLTSWGHFPGHGFSALAAEKEEKNAIRPVSFDNPIEGDNRVYRKRDDYHLTDELLRIDVFPSRSKNEEIRPAAEGDDPVRNPTTVILTGWPDSYYRSYPWGPGRRGWSTYSGPSARDRRGDDADRRGDHAIDEPYLRAIWGEKNLLQPKERGALFGFTSDAPPVYTDVQLRGKPVKKAGGGVQPAVGEGGGIKPAAGQPDNKPEKEKPNGEANANQPEDKVKPAADEGPANDAAIVPAAAAGSATGTGAGPTGSVPTPVASAAGAAGFGGGGAGLLGGMTPGEGGGGGGAPLGGGGLGGGAPTGGGGGGGTPSVGGGGGGSPSTTPNTTGQNQAQGQPQNQGQSQFQSQSQGPNNSASTASGTGTGTGSGVGTGTQSGGGGGNIVPEPPAWVMVVLGMPCLLLLWVTLRRSHDANSRLLIS